MTFDEKLAQALGNTAKARAEQMLAVEKEHRFSLAYRLWEYKTLKNFRMNRYDNRWTLRRAKHIVTMVIFAASTLLLGITAYAAITVIGRYSFDTKFDYSKLFIEGLSSDKTSLEEYYGLSDEDGWEIIDRYVDDTELLVNYRSGKTKVTFCQRIITEEMVGNINTENTYPEAVSLYEENDGFFLAFREDWCALYWIYDGYLFDLNGNIAKDEAINLALSTKIIDFE